ncbi:MAG TPA: hypothetical protein VN457_06715 [Chlamydiales bacterium]|nr:hypothetical protein [Chlamydiales bacterium]
MDVKNMPVPVRRALKKLGQNLRDVLVYVDLEGIPIKEEINRMASAFEHEDLQKAIHQ